MWNKHTTKLSAGAPKLASDDDDEPDRRNAREPKKKKGRSGYGNLLVELVRVPNVVKGASEEAIRVYWRRSPTTPACGCREPGWWRRPPTGGSALAHRPSPIGRGCQSGGAHSPRRKELVTRGERLSSCSGRRGVLLVP
jgi:hypothetical protein